MISYTDHSRHVGNIVEPKTFRHGRFGSSDWSSGVRPVVVSNALRGLRDGWAARRVYYRRVTRPRCFQNVTRRRLRPPVVYETRDAYKTSFNPSRTPVPGRRRVGRQSDAYVRLWTPRDSKNRLRRPTRNANDYQRLSSRRRYVFGDSASTAIQTVSNVLVISDLLLVNHNFLFANLYVVTRAGRRRNKTNADTEKQSRILKGRFDFRQWPLLRLSGF